MEVVDIILWAVYLLIAAATIASVLSAIHGVRTQGRQVAASRLARRASVAAAILPVTVMALTYAAASTTPLTINGKAFTSTLWLRLTDMFIYTSVILIILCFIIVVATKFRR